MQMQSHGRKARRETSTVTRGGHAHALLHLLRPQCGHGKRGDSLSLRPHAVEDEGWNGCLVRRVLGGISVFGVADWSCGPGRVVVRAGGWRVSGLRPVIAPVVAAATARGREAAPAARS